MATFQLITSRVGSQWYQDDISVMVVADENVSGLALTDFTLTAEADNTAMTDMTNDVELASLEGENSVYLLTIIPPLIGDFPANATSAILTLSLAENAVNEGNPAVSVEIRVSTDFPDDDVDVPTELFSVSSPRDLRGITVTPTRIITCAYSLALNDPRRAYLRFFTHDGTEQTGESVSVSNPLFHRGGTFTDPARNVSKSGRIDYFNGDILFSGQTPARPGFNDETGGSRWRYDKENGTITLVAQYLQSLGGIAHSLEGVLIAAGGRIFAYKDGEETEIFAPDGGNVFSTGLGIASPEFAYHDGFLLASQRILNGANSLRLYTLTAEAVTHIARLNVSNILDTEIADVAIYRDTLYLLSNAAVYTLDIKKYRPTAKNTKTTIYPVVANEGDTLDLLQFAPDAERVIPDVGFNKPSYLTINTNSQLAIGTVSETHPVHLPLRAINRIDSQPFSFYLIIRHASAPVWRDVDSITMRANSTYDLHQIVNADSIAFQSGETQPTGSSIANGIFTIATTGGTAYFTATKGTLTADFQVNIVVAQMPDPDNFSDTFTYRVRIADIDVSDDLLELPEVTQSLDVITLNEYNVGEVSLTLSSDNTNAYRYNDGVANNFWESNSLNAAGFQEPIEVFVDSDVNGTVIPHLLFSGVILENVANLEQTSVQLTCVDASLSLSNTNVEAFGTLQKWDALRQQSDEVTNVGVYIPETSLSPMQTQGASAWSDRTSLTLRDLILPSEGPAINNAGYLTSTTLETSDGLLANQPLLKFLGQHRSESVRFLIDQIALNQSVHNVEVDLPAQTVDDPYILNRGSVSYSVENSRVTRRLTDWVYDPTNDRVLMILGQSEGHIADILMQYDVERDAYRTLYTFDKDVKAHRIARRTATDYYILTSSAITQDRSATTLPRTSDSTGYAYDSVADGSIIDIHHYHADTAVLNVSPAAAGADLQPQLGIHYHIGFENEIYVDEFEGIVSEYRGAFKSLGTDIYYRYATDVRFGIARLLNNGSTRQIVSETTLNYHNWLNFGFDMLSDGTVYFVYATGDADESTLTIKSVISGTEATVFTDTQDLADLTHLDSRGGAYLGAYEVLFYDDVLYFFAPIQRVDIDGSDVARSREKAAGLVLFSCNVTAVTPELTVVEKWDFVTHSACNLTVHDGSVHYVERPIAAEVFKPINPDL